MVWNTLYLYRECEGILEKFLSLTNAYGFQHLFLHGHLLFEPGKTLHLTVHVSHNAGWNGNIFLLDG